MINKVRISAEQVEKILSLEESHFVDMKSVDVAPAKLSRTISAFANSDGGELYIGVSELKSDRKMVWDGFRLMEDANGHISVLNDILPWGQYFSCEFLRPMRGNRGHVLHVTVQKTPEVVKASNGIPYVRRSAQNMPVQGEGELERLKRNKGVTSFESEGVPLELDWVANSEVIIGFMLEVIPTADPLAWLRKQRLIIGDRPTVAAVLLFSDEPQVALPKRSAIKIYRYRTDDAEGSRETLSGVPLTIEGCLYGQIKDAVDSTVKIIQEVEVLGVAGFESIKYPHETLHEIITNAVLHRDYGIADDVHVRIFDNRVEVESPGRLPAHITADNILRERFARNGMIVRLINKFPDPPNKDVGEGLNTAFAAMKKLQLQDPVILERDNSVVVEIRHQKLASPEKIVIDFLASATSITNEVARTLTGIGSERKVTDLFRKLRDAGAIEPAPRDGGRFAWRLKR
ncbi:hypothetical protein GCM10010492_75820 [Saccharothrix mutabilis subsp. mutabilis]|uniref:Schlafen AlbA-2 domain-containing protein n=2 Tax=Saccharothrix mutabilis TaxID=33921 RepID=A0ABN0UWH6_9PSEU